ncbi:MAG TPA: metallophosphoesterase, partial [Devosia sp.]|nr:metallophosphoesterase [Devosia sp.]
KLRLVMLSDFHFSEPWIGLQALDAIVEKTNALNPDIILLIGDFEDGPRFSRPVPPGDWARGLARLQARLGVHAVLGNHDYPRLIAKRHRFLARPPAQLALEEAGIPVHINDAIALTSNGKTFWLAGLGDQCTEFEDGTPLHDLEATLARVSGDAPVILMAHEPDIFPQVPARVALTLSGHVHRGQIRFFGLAPVVPSRFGRRYLHGHIVEDRRHLIVGAGLGHSGLPLRFDAAPEIVLIELGGQA